MQVYCDPLDGSRPATRKDIQKKIDWYKEINDRLERGEPLSEIIKDEPTEDLGIRWHPMKH